jgi:hypothetical protein
MNQRVLGYQVGPSRTEILKYFMSEEMGRKEKIDQVTDE